MPIRLISRQQVTELLPMSKAIGLMREGFQALSDGGAEMPPRQKVLTQNGDMLIKPALLPGKGLCVKLALSYPGNPATDSPLVQGLVMVFDDATGTPRAVMDAAELTAIRTGGGGGLAIDLLARAGGSSVTLIGTGVQGRTQLQAAMEVRPVTRVFLSDPNTEAAAKLEAEILALPHPPAVTFITDADQGVADSDIVITATGSPAPTFSGSAVRPDTHINGIGAYQPDRREIDEETMRRAYVVVDGFQAAGTEAGELLIPGIQPDAELAELVSGRKPGRTDGQQITVFKSVGMAIQDAVAAIYVLEEAERRNLGSEIDLF